MNKVCSGKEVIQYNAETKNEELVRNKAYADIVIHGNNKWNGIRTEISRVHLIKNYNVGTNQYSSNDNLSIWSHIKPSKR